MPEPDIDASEQAHWYALHTRARHERAVAAQLYAKGVKTYVPCVREVHRWSDRKKIVEVPLFTSYVFVHDIFARANLRTLQTYGVLRWIGSNGEATPIPDWQIHGIRSLTENQVPISRHPFIRIGQRVRIRGGCLDGVQGILVADNGDRKLVISIEMVQRSVATTVDGYQVEPA